MEPNRRTYIFHVLTNNEVCYIYDCKNNKIVRIQCYLLLLIIFPLFQLRAYKNVNDVKLDHAVIKVTEENLSAVLTQRDNEGGKFLQKMYDRSILPNGSRKGSYTGRPATNYYYKHPISQVW